MVREMSIPLTVKLDAETHTRLEELARKKGVSKAEVVREAIIEYLEKHSGSVVA
jgi:predicted DNA-binding protein